MSEVHGKRIDTQEGACFIGLRQDGNFQVHLIRKLDGDKKPVDLNELFATAVMDGEQHVAFGMSPNGARGLLSVLWDALVEERSYDVVPDDPADRTKDFRAEVERLWQERNGESQTEEA